MLMTEQEAHTKWCPKYQVCGEDGDNRPEAHQMENSKWVRVPGSIASSACCVASACMAWRWADPAEKHERRMCETCGGTGGNEERACLDCEGEGMCLHFYPTPARRGYCGAFGRPEA